MYLAVYLRPFGSPVNVQPTPKPSSQAVPVFVTFTPSGNSPRLFTFCAFTSISSGTVSVLPLTVMTRYAGVVT